MRTIRIRGASEHNLRHISLDLPRDALAVFTGVSGSGKSSLVFDTIYKEGRRRFLESLPSYARRFLGGFEKPDVESIEGLSPAVSIEQKTIQRSPRSTVGTITEVYDHLRLLFARLGLPHCPSCARPVRSQSPEQVVDQLLARFAGERVFLCAPIVRDRKGEHRRELDALRRDGYRRLWIDGRIVRLGEEELALERRRAHTIEVVLDRLEAVPARRSRLVEAVEKCFSLADEMVHVRVDREGSAEGHIFSGRFACADCGIDLPELEPRLFSFNSPHGRCPACAGLGERAQVDPERLVLDPERPLGRGGLAVLEGNSTAHPLLDADQVAALLRRLGVSADDTWGGLEPETRERLLQGDGGVPGLVAAVEAALAEDPDSFADITSGRPCPDCGGSRLAPLPRAVTFHDRSLPELVNDAVGDLGRWLASLELDGVDRAVGTPILREVRSRLGFLEDVGLSYLTLGRSAHTLAGGEAQRIRLASQVGADLQGVVIVLDEPSIGLHARDNARLLETLGKLRDKGNSVLVVEHDRETIESADWLVDLGPGAGTAGGRLVAEGGAEDLARSSESVTGAYLAGREAIEVPASRRAPGERWLEVLGARHNNLQDIDARIPLGVLVVVTGVSGSGKSSLVNQVLRPALLRRLGRRGSEAGAHRGLRGADAIDKVIDIDQSPIGRSPRSNPATYTRLFGPMRELFAKLPEARVRGYTAGRFSFNVDGGRCLECGGAGLRVIDMQFLAPVEITCEACGGRRYNRETLEVLYRGRSIHDVLELTISEALELFRDQPRIQRPLAVLEKVGLGYLRLGQPSTTLSGGEAQRLKLASELQRRETGRTLYILDEPTTGLHFEDVRVLLVALHELVERGNSVLVIEHNLDVVKCADWVLDLGPDGGEDGGRVVAEGTPEDVSRVESSHTGRALREELERRPGLRRRREARGRPQPETLPRAIRVEGASIHNLEGLTVEIPRGRMSVVTGVSGSGKTSLAFDTLFAEGQRRYIESLSTYARQFLGRLEAPPVERITGLEPAIAIDQKSAGGSRRSTVATITEIHDYLRLLFARVGRAHCPECGEPLAAVSPSRLAAELVSRNEGERVWVLAPVRLERADEEEVRGQLARLLRAGFTRVLAGREEVRLDEDEDSAVRRVLHAIRGGGADPRERLLAVVDRVIGGSAVQSRLAQSVEQAFVTGEGTVAVRVGDGPLTFHTRAPSCPGGHFSSSGELIPRMFSFNSFEGACERCHGTGLERRIDADALVAHPDRPLPQALDKRLSGFLEACRPSVLRILSALLRERKVSARAAYETLREDVRRAVLHGEGAARVVVDFPGGEHAVRWEGLLPLVEQWMRDEDPALWRWGLESLSSRQVCSVCGGRRLRPQFLAVRVGGLSIDRVVEMTIAGARSFFRSLELRAEEARIACDALREVENRLRFLEDVGLGYLALDRPANTLSGGEAQRIRLASQLGNRLVGVLYVLDEPTVGLHPRDTHRLLASLRELRDQGNTVVLVEHDRETIEAADWVVDLGPGAGERGGRVVACGTPADVASHALSLTGRYLRGEARVAPQAARRPRGDRVLRLEGVTCHNLEALDVEFPLGLLTAVTGVSGSGKSTLVMDVLAKVLKDGLEGSSRRRAERAFGLDAIEKAVTITQRPIGRTPQSTPATYTGIWDDVRALYAELPLAKSRGWSPSRFSFNSPDGRCQACSGLGSVQIEMHFLSDVWVTCDVCRGRRFDEATLEVRFKGKSVSDVLALEVDEALEVFENHPRIAPVLRTLQSVGLGYVRLGQAATTLSGGEAQRLKLASELVERAGGNRLYILDEPTTGLHFEDVRRLAEVLQRLVDQGNTLIVIEHNLDLIALADWVIDLGPEAGAEGGRIVAEGTPEEVARVEESVTGQYLRRTLGPEPSRTVGARPASDR